MFVEHCLMSKLTLENISVAKYIPSYSTEIAVPSGQP